MYQPPVTQCGLPSQQNLQQIIEEENTPEELPLFLRLIQNSKNEWNTLDLRKELERKFPTILSEEEKNESLDVFYRTRIATRLVIGECLQLKLVKLQPSVEKFLMKATDLKDLKLFETDI